MRIDVQPEKCKYEYVTQWQGKQVTNVVVWIRREGVALPETFKKHYYFM